MDFQYYLGYLIFGSVGLWLIFFPKSYAKTYLRITKEQMPKKVARIIGLGLLLLLTVAFFFTKK